VVEPGRRSLGDRYELTALIAAGGMGQVWRGSDSLLGRPVAVKVLRSEYTADPTFQARFRAEAQHAAALSHPNIAAVFDYGETETADGEALSYLVMELVEGEPLSAVLHREGRLDAEATLSLLEQTASALAEAHRVGLVHRDVKPGNILVRGDGSVKITDFGIAWSADSVPLTRTGQVIGTPQYLAPEVAEGKHATPASDVYALGLVGYECLCGHPAFEGDNAVTIALKQVREDPDPLPDELPGEVRTLIRRALSKDPAVRMPDGAAFAAAIEDLRAGRPQIEPPATRAVAVPPPGQSGSGERPAAAPSPPGPRTGSTPGPHTISPPARRRHRLAAVLVPLLTLLLGAGVAAGVFVAVNNDPSPAPRPASQTEDAEILLDSADYVGRPVDEVALALSALGLLVSRQQQVSPDSVPGLVTGLEPPRGSLRPGDEVVVRYAVAPPPTPTSQRAATPATGHAGDQTAPAPPEPEEDAAPAAPTASEAPRTTELPASTPPSSPTTTAPTTTTTAPTTTTTTATAPPTTTAPSSSTASEEPSWPPDEDDDGDEG
jgi:serine/threonine-protein kinase